VFGFGPQMIFAIPALLIALTVHEYAHARAAVALGDPTPRYAGRLTLNPIPHLDPFGLIMLWLAQFGWAKPVPVNPFNLRNYRWGMLAVSLAGPGANVLTAFVVAVLYAFLRKMGINNYELMAVIGLTYQYNIVLAVFNLIPLPPLDGAQIVSSLLPGRQAEIFERIAPYSPFILMLLIVLPYNIIGRITYPFREFLGGIISALVALIL
jgi:Zn-dependent protease